MTPVWLCLLASLLRIVQSSEYCVCTTVPCPQAGNNHLVMGNGYATLDYTYSIHGEFPVVTAAKAVLEPQSLDNGTETTTCTRKYAKMLEDDGQEDCDAGHILAHRLGGYGNQPLNIFPQNISINRGSYATFEGQIYECMQQANQGFLSWVFTYGNSTSTQPNGVTYGAEFDKGCDPMTETFLN